MALRDKIERWLVHEALAFRQTQDNESIFHFTIKHAGESGVPVEIFEPNSQPGILVIGCKAIMKNSHIARYLNFSDIEKKNFEAKIADFCKSIGAVHRMHNEDGKRKVGVYVVLDKEEDIDSANVVSAIGKAAEMHDKVAKYLIKTF